MLLAAAQKVTIATTGDNTALATSIATYAPNDNTFYCLVTAIITAVSGEDSAAQSAAWESYRTVTNQTLLGAGTNTIKVSKMNNTVSFAWTRLSNAAIEPTSQHLSRCPQGKASDCPAGDCIMQRTCEEGQLKTKNMTHSGASTSALQTCSVPSAHTYTQKQFSQASFAADSV